MTGDPRSGRGHIVEGETNPPHGYGDLSGKQFDEQRDNPPLHHRVRYLGPERCRVPTWASSTQGRAVVMILMRSPTHTQADPEVARA